MKVTYIGHSGFCLEYEDIVLVFDYFKGVLPEISTEKSIYVFASHAHYDHFQKEIFLWARKFPNITYILSDDIREQDVDLQIVRIGPNEKKQIGELAVQTLKSTDEGVAFLVNMRGKAIYHAGDLNWWHWEEENKVFNSYMKKRYQGAIARIKGEQIDVAFVPLDARQGVYYYLGMDWFLRHTNTRVVFPMHMSEAYGVCEEFLSRPESAPYKKAFQKIEKQQQVFEV